MMKKIVLAVVMVMALNGCVNKEQKTPEPVKVKSMTVGDNYGTLSQGYSGTIEEMSATALSFAMGGTIKQLLVEEGQMVRQGQVLATIDATTANNGLETARATTSQAGDIVQQAQDVYNQALDAYNRLKILHDNGSLPEIKWIEAETRLKQAETALKSAQTGVKSAQATERIARKSVTDTRMIAPTSGYVARRSVEVGQNLLPGAPVMSILKIDHVKVKFSVPESEINRFVKGQQVEVKVSALAGRAYRATITEKGVSADPLSRTYEVKALIANSDLQLLPGMVCEVTADGGSQAKQTILLPAHIVQLEADNTTFVWAIIDGKARKTPVTTGGNVGDNVVIVSGLKHDDKVICVGQQKVSEGMNVTE